MSDREKGAVTKIEISFGTRWVQELAALYARIDHRPLNHTIELEILTDVLDLDVGDRNLTECISRERLFPFLTDLLNALARTRHNPHHKAFVESGEEPWEFVLITRDAETLLFSLYGVDSDREIICHDLPLDRGALERACNEAAGELLEELARVAPTLGQAREAARLRAAREALEVAKKLELPERLAAPSRASQCERQGGSEHRSGWGFRYRYDASDVLEDLFCVEQPLDLHVLLFSGVLVLEHRGEATLTFQPYPFLVLDALTRQLQQHFKKAREASITSSHLMLEQTKGSKKREHVRVSDPGARGDIPEVELDVVVLTELTLELADLVRRDLLEVSPQLSRNRRFIEVFSRMAVLREQLAVRGVREEPASSAPDHARTQDTSGAASDGEAELTCDLLRSSGAGGDFPWSMSNVLAMHPHLTWVLSQEELRLRRVVLAGDVLVVGTARGVMGVDSRTGEQKWRFEQGAVRLGALFVYGNGRVVHQTQHDELVVLRVENGALEHRLILPRAHRIVGALQGKKGRVILLEERGAVTALDLESGVLSWHHSGLARGAALHAWARDAIVTMQGGTLTRLAPEDGEVVWQVDAGHYARQVCIHQGRAVVIGAGAHRAQTNVRAFEMSDGARRQELSLDGYFLGPARSFGDDLWLMIERGRRPVVESLRGRELIPAWVRPLREQMRTLIPAWEEVEVMGERGVLIQTAASQTVLLRHEDGIPLWSHDAAPIMRAPIAPVLINEGFLTLGDSLELRRISNGALLYRFDGFLDEPCVMIARGSLDVLMGEQSLDDGSPTLLCLSFAHYLAVV
jgi:outer membrane protein assembly factor BamB